MQGVYLKFYVQESRRHHGLLAYEWLLETAKKSGIPGGSAFRAIAGYGRHGNLHEQHFYELAGELPVAVEFLLTSAEADAMIARLRNEKVNVFYTRVAAEFGVL